MGTIKYLLPQNATYYKANLHTHSIISDGKLTPEEVKQQYKAAGYQIVALTDHSVTTDQQHLCDEDFLFITGTEICFEDTVNPYKCRHLCLLSKDPHLLWQPFRDPDMLPHMPAYFDRCICENMDNRYTPEAMNAVVARANLLGFLVTYNHPAWSQESYPDYAPMEGIWGMEYRNSSCITSGFDENNGWVYQELLRLGKRIVPVMADDMHRAVKPNGAKVLGVSWNMVAAPEFSYSGVMQALEKGDLYASCGPEIYSLTCDGNTISITCSPAASIQLVTQTRAAVYRCTQNGQPLTHADLPLDFWRKRTAGDPEGFVRLIVTAPDGTYAVTRAYRLNEL